MTSLDLLKYLIDVQKIEKEDLAELIGIPQKKMDSVLSGAVPLKKKWLKNLSLYTGIPTESIVTGNFVLNYPTEAQEPQAIQGEAPAVSELAPEIEENLKQYNYERLMHFCKGRYKKFHRFIKQAIVIQIAAAIVGLLITLACGLFVVVQKPMGDIFMFPLVSYIPAVIAFLPVGALYKIAKAGSLAEEKNFKIYTLISILPMLFHVIAAVCFKVYPVWAIGLAVISALPLLYFIFVNGFEKKLTDKKISFGMVLSYVLSIAIAFTALVGEFINRDTDPIIITAGLIASVVAWGVAAIALYFVSYFYRYLHKVVVTSKHFKPIPEKQVLKKHHLRDKIIALVLAAIISFGGTYIISCAVMQWHIDSVVNSEENPLPEFSEYDKTDIVFTEADHVITIDNEFYTVKIPADLKINEKITNSETYASEPTGCIVSLYSDGNMYKAYLSKLYYNEEESERINKYLAELKQELIDTYGFFPQSAYELKQITRDVYENGVSFWNRKQAAAVISLLIFDATLNYNDEEFFYVDSQKELVLTIRRLELSDGKQTVTCTVEGSKKGEYDNYVSINILVRSDYADEELIYKIINSIEMK